EEIESGEATDNTEEMDAVVRTDSEPELLLPVYQVDEAKEYMPPFPEEEVAIQEVPDLFAKENKEEIEDGKMEEAEEQELPREEVKVEIPIPQIRRYLIQEEEEEADLPSIEHSPQPVPVLLNVSG